MMKKFFLLIMMFQILFSCNAKKAIYISDIENSTSKFEHYIVELNSGEKIKTKYVFNRAENLELYSQGQSMFYPISDIKSISGINDDNKKGWIILGSTIVVGSVISAILLNNGASVNDEK